MKWSSCNESDFVCYAPFQGLPGAQGVNGFPGPKGPPVREIFPV